MLGKIMISDTFCVCVCTYIYIKTKMYKETFVFVVVEQDLLMQW